MELSFNEYKFIVEFSPNMIWRSGLDAGCDYFNETWLRFTGKNMEEEVGSGWTEGVHPEDYEICMKTYLEAFSKREPFEMEYRLIRHDGKWRWLNDRGVPIFDDEGSFTGYVGSCIDVTEKVEGKKLKEMASKDALTGLFNRNYIECLLEYEFYKVRHGASSFIAMMMDIDKFKHFNDHFGHSFGDKVLNRVAGKIAQSIRKSDLAGRFGGDEFLIVLPDAELDDAEEVARRILQSVRLLVIDDIELEISMSIGIAKHTNEKKAEEVVEKADLAMYQAKQQGGNRFRIYE